MDDFTDVNWGEKEVREGIVSVRLSKRATPRPEGPKSERITCGRFFCSIDFSCSGVEIVEYSYHGARFHGLSASARLATTIYPWQGRFDAGETAGKQLPSASRQLARFRIDQTVGRASILYCPASFEKQFSSKIRYVKVIILGYHYTYCQTPSYLSKYTLLSLSMIFCHLVVYLLFF